MKVISYMYLVVFRLIPFKTPLIPFKAAKTNIKSSKLHYRYTIDTVY